MKIKNKFVIFLISAAILSGLFWGLSYEKDPRPEISGSGGGERSDEAARVILKDGLFSDSFKQLTNADRLFYPIFLAGVYKVFGYHYRAVTLVQIALFVLIVLLVYRLGQMVFNEKIARWAGIFTALCYSIASFAGWFYREVFFTFLVTFFIYSLYKAQLTKKSMWFVVSGLLAGLAILTNSVIQVFILVALINLLIICRLPASPRRRAQAGKDAFLKIYPKIGLFLVTFVLTIGPWLMSGYFSFGGGKMEGLLFRERAEKLEHLQGKYWQHFIGNTLGDFFAQKWFPGYNPREVRHGLETWERNSEWLLQGKDPAVINQIFLQEAKGRILKHPIMYLKQTSIDFLKFNTPLVPNDMIQHTFAETHPELPGLVKGGILISIRLIYLVFFILIFYAMVKYFKNWSKMGWLILIVFYFNGIFSFVHAIARYSVPVYPFYIILATLGLFSLLKPGFDKFVETRFRST